MSTIAAIGTPVAIGSIGVIRISGEEAYQIVGKIFRPVSKKKIEAYEGYTSGYGHIYEGEEKVDEVIVHFYRAPKSYTGENVVEISCHGGIYLVEKVLKLVLKEGAKLAEGGEFTKRAILNGKMSLTQGEGIMDLITAQSEESAKAAMGAREGRLYKTLMEIKEDLVKIGGHLAAFIDYPEEDIEEIGYDSMEKKLTELLIIVEELAKTYDYGSMIKEGVKTLIIGKPNVGKSSLMNALAKTEKSIVTGIAGTTRDIVEDKVVMGKVILRLLDTAGIRETQDEIEEIGKKKALGEIDKAELILVVLDGSEKLSKEDREVLNATKGRRRIGIINKGDLEEKIERKELEEELEQLLTLSIQENKGLEEIEKGIEKILSIGEVNLGMGIIANARQKAGVEKAKEGIKRTIQGVREKQNLDIISFQIEENLTEILELSGEKATEVVIDEVFSQFCVGK